MIIRNKMRVKLTEPDDDVSSFIVQTIGFRRALTARLKSEFDAHTRVMRLGQSFRRSGY